MAAVIVHVVVVLAVVIVAVRGAVRGSIRGAGSLGQERGALTQPRLLPAEKGRRTIHFYPPCALPEGYKFLIRVAPWYLKVDIFTFGGEEHG